MSAPAADATHAQDHANATTSLVFTKTPPPERPTVPHQPRKICCGAATINNQKPQHSRPSGSQIGPRPVNAFGQPTPRRCRGCGRQASAALVQTKLKLLAVRLVLRMLLSVALNCSV